ncbi:hypothetical protein NE237_025847 [Protea cynaroides]|uniref:Uncharacterized protein n=1 Tax=Protea cynaroides TaxID=273540 RepID=A0A9Q0H501_9MAGN|nr:hypothetical protein NE237_025847 [Protea cynaroides]
MNFVRDTGKSLKLDFWLAITECRPVRTTIPVHRQRRGPNSYLQSYLQSFCKALKYLWKNLTSLHNSLTTISQCICSHVLSAPLVEHMLWHRARRQQSTTWS